MPGVRTKKKAPAAATEEVTPPPSGILSSLGGTTEPVAVAAAVAEAPVAVAEAPVVAAVAVAPAPAKKKGSSAKKEVKVIAVVTPDGIEGSFAPEPRRPLIAHLPIRTNEVVFHDQPLQYDPTPPSLRDPEPYDPMSGDVFHPQPEVLSSPTPKPDATSGKNETVAAQPSSTEAPTTPASTPTSTEPAKPFPCFKKVDLMVQFKGAVAQKKLPDQTDIACFWCAHTFGWMPCVIPEREVEGVYNVYGNFCCPECAMAYLLSEAVDPHVRWERMALLQRIYDQSGKGRIFPAPARESLKFFGGAMTIDEYRATMRAGKVRVDVHMPPMVSILGSIDTKPIDFFEMSVNSGMNGNTMLMQRSVEEGLRLKRTKPLKDRDSTLDTVMNIRIGVGAR